MEDVNQFLAGLTPAAVKKVFFNIEVAENANDPRVFKKLTKEIWELRTQHGGIQIRLLAFWDKTQKTNTLVVATHGFIKKVDKVPEKEIKRALQIRKQYFAQLNE